MATANPRTTPTSVARGSVPQRPASKAPSTGGTANSSPIVETREAHRKPTDRFEGGSSGRVTHTPTQPSGRSNGTRIALLACGEELALGPVAKGPGNRH